MKISRPASPDSDSAPPDPPEPVAIRPATPPDVPGILAMVRELAEFENLSHQVEADKAGYREHLFGERPVAEALVAETAAGTAGEGELVGYAIHFATFSTFLGRAGVWLEDLYVRPGWRGQGIGERLLRSVVARAEARGAGRCEWSVLDWNERAIHLYERLGGEVLEEWRIVRLERGGIRALAAPATGPPPGPGI